jgi:nucleoid-associated protein YgaU
MTRETKIGLLVGLAFIIVIGILLSDYNRTDTQPAALALVANDVRAGTATMHNGSNVNEVVLPPAAPAPVRPVPTREEVRKPETTIDIGPGPGTPTKPATPANPVTPNNTTEANPNSPSPELVDEGNHGSGADRNLPPIPGVETYDPHRHVTTPPANPNSIAAGPTVNGAKQYVAIEGDTLSKLAGRFLGVNNKSNRDAILAINPTLKQNPNNLIVGRTYMIPPTSAKSTTPGAIPVAPTPAIPEHPVAAAPKPATGPQYFYTVKENDNLWRIAASQLGDGNAWVAIKELNKDVLKGKDDLRPNMRLRLPAKPIASIE